MIIGVISVAVVQASIMDEIHVRAVLHHGVFFTIMAVSVRIAGDARNQFFSRGVGSADFDHMLVHMPIVAVVEVAIMQVINMPAMIERGMAAACAMRMAIMRGVDDLMCGKRCGQQG